MSDADAYEFIRTCLAYRSESKRRSALQPFVNRGVDWEKIQREAGQHRILCPLFRALEDVFGHRLPSSLREEIQEHRRGVRIQNAFVIQELGRVVQRFEEADLSILVMKGPVLAQTAYGDIALRQSVDADVFIPKEQFLDVERTLREIGYEYAEKREAVSGWRKPLSLYFDGQWEFTRGKSFTLDVHTRLLPPGYSFPSDFQRFWDRARTIRLNEDVSVPSFSAEDQALVMVQHGIKNQWRILRHVVDIAATVHGKEKLDWEVLLSRAKETYAAQALKLSLQMARDLLDVTLPSHVQEWAVEERMRDVTTSMQAYLQDRSCTSTLSYRKRVRLQLATKDTLAGQVRYGIHSLLQHFWSAVLRP
jgi:hypothetical protein